MSRPRPCLDCGTPTRNSRCPACTATRGNPYDYAWQQLRAHVIARDNGICWACGQPGATSAHHLRAVKHWGAGLPDPADVVACHIACNAKLGAPI